MNNKVQGSQKIAIASNNLGKIKEFQRLLCSDLFTLFSPSINFEVAETGSTFIENARIKAISFARYSEQWSLADDSGLCVHSLEGAPGVYSARYAKSDQARIARLLSELEPFPDRTATFKSALCIASPDNKVLLEIQGVCNGLITPEPRGSNGFGYDPIFEVNNTGLTFAQMTLEAKQAFSHRGKACNLLKPLLEDLIKNRQNK